MGAREQHRHDGAPDLSCHTLYGLWCVALHVWRDADDGCSIFWRTAEGYELIEVSTRRLVGMESKLWCEWDLNCGMILEADPYSKPSCVRRWSQAVEVEYQQSLPHLDRDNVALLVVLRDRRGRVLLVANTHLLFNPKRGA